VVPVVVRIEGSGTPERAWQAWGGLDELPALPLHPLPSRAVFVAPHPDDAVLGVGGALAWLAAVGVPVTVIAASDGAASHPASPTVPPAEMARRRRDERRLALRRLGAGQAAVRRCGLPDGAMAEHEAALTRALTESCDANTWCWSTWAGDGHPDHEAARLLSYPVWTWHWADPGDRRVPWHRAHRVALPEPMPARKRRAIEAFTSQIEPLSELPGDEAVLPPASVARLARGFEVVLR
jgi:LmbE family N-acetylglucosaminyl deacetylase